MNVRRSLQSCPVSPPTAHMYSIVLSSQRPRLQCPQINLFVSVYLLPLLPPFGHGYARHWQTGGESAHTLMIIHTLDQQNPYTCTHVATGGPNLHTLVRGATTPIARPGRRAATVVMAVTSILPIHPITARREEAGHAPRTTHRASRIWHLTGAPGSSRAASSRWWQDPGGRRASVPTRLPACLVACGSRRHMHHQR